MKSIENYIREKYPYQDYIHIDDVIKYSKEYAQQFIEAIADEVNQWENSGQMREDILEIFNPQNK